MASKAFSYALDWASDLEIFVSALKAGLSNGEALTLLASRSSRSWRSVFELAAQKYEQVGNLSVSLADTKRQVADSRFDLFCELLVANNQLGGAGLIDSITRFAQHTRHLATTNEDSQSRIRSVLSIARLGVASPWIMLALLCTRPENAGAYLSGSGPIVVLVGLICSVIAWIAVRRISAMPKSTRGLAA